MRVRLVLCVFALLAVGRLANAEILPNLRSTEVIEGRAVAMAGNSLTINQRTIYLFGIDVPPGNAVQAAAARQSLDALLSTGPILCSALRSWFRGMLAICKSSDGNDVALTMLRSGAVVVLPSQVLASPLEASYIAAEAIARDTAIGIWRTKTSPSHNSQEALDKIAVALATPPDPVPTDTWLWYIYPWQGMISGVLGLMGAALILFVAKYQIKSERIKLSNERLDKRRGILYRYKRDISIVRREAKHIKRIVMKSYEENDGNYYQIIRDIKKHQEFTAIKIPKNFNVSPEEFSIVGYEIGVEIENTLDGIELQNHLFRIINEMEDEVIESEQCDEISNGANESLDELLDHIEKTRQDIDRDLARISSEIKI